MNADDENIVKFLPEFSEPKHFHQRLKFIRVAREMSQSELGHRAGININQISHFETGSRLPSFENLRNLSIALKCTSDYLLGLSDGKYEDGYRRGALDAVEAMKAATLNLRRGIRTE